jgi:hypothetical protein
MEAFFAIAVVLILGWAWGHRTKKRIETSIALRREAETQLEALEEVRRNREELARVESDHTRLRALVKSGDLNDAEAWVLMRKWHPRWCDEREEQMEQEVLKRLNRTMH